MPIFKHEFPPLLKNFSFYFQGGDDQDKNPVYQVTVTNPPTTESVAIWYQFPAYTKEKATPSSTSKPIVMSSGDGNELYNYIQSDTGFAAGYQRYEPRMNTIEKVKQLLPDAKMAIVSAKWCPDCRRNVPKMARIVENLHWDVKIIDRDTEGVVEKYDIKKIPTFIVMDKDGKEMTRIIESPKYTNLEEDLLKIAENQY